MVSPVEAVGNDGDRLTGGLVGRGGAEELAEDLTVAIHNPERTDILEVDKVLGGDRPAGVALSLSAEESLSAVDLLLELPVEPVRHDTGIVSAEAFAVGAAVTRGRVISPGDGDVADTFVVLAGILESHVGLAASHIEGRGVEERQGCAGGASHLDVAHASVHDEAGR